MSYPSNINGLELFDTPFQRTQAKRQQAQESEQQMGAKPAAQQPKTAAPAVQGQKPESSEVQHKRTETQAVSTRQTDTGTRADLQPKPSVSEQKSPSSQSEAATPKEKALSAQPEKTAHEAADKNPKQHQEAQEPPKSNVPADEKKQPAPPQKELVLDMSAGTTDGKPPTEDDEAKRKAEWEAAEAQRKKEWDAKQLAKKQAEEAAVKKLQEMDDNEAVAASIERVKTDVERITRRNMKECVAAHISELCQRDACFARLTLNPRKTMINAFKRINSEAKKYVEQEMQENGIKPENCCYGSDVPDGLCYQWAEDYFNDPDAPEDKQIEEKFVERPYISTASKPKKSAASKTKKADKPAKKEKEKQETSSEYQQMSFV